MKPLSGELVPGFKTTHGLNMVDAAVQLTHTPAGQSPAYGD